jgi:hypothetical protein
MKMQASLGNPILIFIYTFAVLLLGCAIGAHWHRISGTAFCLVLAGAALMVIHDMATGVLWFWITANLARSVYDRKSDARRSG